ncbi:hypothetical protein K227x_47720 [Rubripirellula lacrimiformis]|uniref:Zinc-finger domain-containing protein n=1 Tax=Rubripirellula lacrimiformis TaxID=1930273 RepID=A0A517NH22_9BACT|nr:hypothetical protein [Rubripirellula lacrimiformis]QDT06363.1 hypothetical protein K227x_47720 [Rubripirellula lacrimiformis]
MMTATIADDMPLDPDDELLVAYLDGELERSDRTALENRLLDDETLRVRLQELQSGWDMLEALPSEAPNTKLVETTLELVVADLVKHSPPKRSWLNRYRFPLGVAASCVIAIGLAVIVTQWVNRARFNHELRGLAIAESLDAYKYDVDLDLMRQLSRDQEWLHMVHASRSLDGVTEEPVSIADIPLDEREAAITALPVEQRSPLFSRWERYNQLDPPTRKKIQSLADVVAQQTDAEQLLDTMRAYAVWRESLPTKLVDAIEGSQGQSQRDAINQGINETMISISEQSSRKLSDETIERIYFALRKILDRRLQKLTASQKTDYAEYEQRFGGGRGVDWFLLFVLFGHSSERSEKIPAPKFLPDREHLRSDELDYIRLILSDNDLETLRVSTGGDALLNTMMLTTWAEEAIRRKSPRPRRNRESSLEKYLEMPSDRRDEFELLPPDRMLEELSKPWGRFSG